MAGEQWISEAEAVAIIRARIKGSIGRAEAILRRALATDEIRAEPKLLLCENGIMTRDNRYENQWFLALPRPAISKDDFLDWLDQNVKEDTKSHGRRKTPVMQNRAREALAALWPDGVPDQSKLPNKYLTKLVNEWVQKDCEDHGIGYIELKLDTILRAASRK
jgi:hypothetical protein